MLETIKNSSLMTKLLYIFAFILFVVWVIPKMNSYYTSVNSYEKSIEELKSISSKHRISTITQKFSETTFKADSELLFSKVELQNLSEDTYKVNILIAKEDLSKFHTYIETLSLLYYVEIKDDLKFTTVDEIINVQMVLKAF